MSETRSRRGRPKGTGIDDRQTLTAIAHLMAGNPALKPTTAIRSLGVSDPSVIRRLRDKFKGFSTEAARELSSTSGPRRPNGPRARNATAAGSAQPRHDSRSAAQPARTATRARACNTPASGPRLTANDDDGERAAAPRATNSFAPHDLMLSLLGAGFAATQTALAAQAAFADELVRSPYVSLALRQKLAFNSWAMGFANDQLKCPKTVR